MQNHSNSRVFLRATGLMVLLLLGASCSKRETVVEKGLRTGTLYLGNSAEPADLDPQIVTAYTDMNILVALFEGLTTLDEATANPQPGASDRWEMTPDGLKWTFHIRDRAKWSNGDPLTAGDFVYSYRRILSPKLASEYSYMLWPIKGAQDYNEGRLSDFSQVGVRAADDRTLEIILRSPCPWFLALTAHQAWFPVQQKTIEKFGGMDARGTQWTRPENFVGNGPFTLKEWIPNSRVVAGRNPNYWDNAHATLENVVFLPNENIATDEKEFRAGQIHMTYELPPDKIAAYQKEAPEKLRIDPFLETFFLRFNVTKAPLDNQKLRQALARGIGREAITRSILRGSRIAARSMTPPGTGGYTSVSGITDDFNEARRLLGEAGYPGGKGLPTLEVQIKSDDIHQSVLEAIQSMWKQELGVNIRISPLEQKTWVQNQQTMAYQICTSRWIGDYVDPNTFLDMWLTKGGNNLTGWSNEQYDRQISEAAITLNQNKRQALQQSAEAILLNEAPVAPIYYGTRVYLIHPGVHNWVPTLLGLHRYQYIRLEKN